MESASLVVRSLANSGNGPGEWTVIKDEVELSSESSEHLMDLSGLDCSSHEVALRLHPAAKVYDPIEMSLSIIDPSGGMPVTQVRAPSMETNAAMGRMRSIHTMDGYQAPHKLFKKQVTMDTPS